MTLRGVHGVAKVLLFQILLPTIKGELQLIGSPEPVVGLVGHDCVLPCSLHPAHRVDGDTVEWTRPDLDPIYVHIFSYGRLLNNDQNPSFEQRTNLSENKLRHGDMSLTLSKLRLSDEGTYKCKFVTQESTFDVQVPLVVGAVSEPQMSLERSDDKLVFKCEAKKWYPKPEMEWRDSKGTVIPHEDINTVYDEYYSVSSSIKVDFASSDNYTCTVQQQDIGQVRKAILMTPEVYGEVASLKISRYTLIGWLIVLGLFICALIMGSLMYNWETLVARCRGADEPDEAVSPLIQRLQTENNNLQEQVTLLQQQKEGLTTENSHLREEVERLERENQDLRTAESSL
uniref:butyrophilin subfamily 1 member A1-like n=1 Tax=Semicossyphus pulcher TaxID=241346 RepID=UPI0037E868C1